MPPKIMAPFMNYNREELSWIINHLLVGVYFGKHGLSIASRPRLIGQAWFSSSLPSQPPQIASLLRFGKDFSSPSGNIRKWALTKSLGSERSLGCKSGKRFDFLWLGACFTLVMFNQPDCHDHKNPSRLFLFSFSHIRSFGIQGRDGNPQDVEVF